jgi:RNA polymerase sigma factor (sigma-70 family)
MTTEEYNRAVDLYSDRVYRFILKNVKDNYKAEDIVQDSYEKLWQNCGSVNFLKVRQYLFTTAYHTLIDRIRKEKRISSMEDLKLGEHSHEEHFSDIKEVLDMAVEKLPEVHRMVLLLRDYEGYSYKEIADLASLSETQVKVYIYRARVFLKDFIGSVDVLV